MSQTKQPFSEVMDYVDQQKAERARDKFGMEAKWLLSWHKQETGQFLARLSVPGIEHTYEALGDCRMYAISNVGRQANVESERNAKQERAIQ